LSGSSGTGPSPVPMSALGGLGVYLALWWAAERVSLRALRVGSLTRLGLRKTGGKLVQPINSPARYPEYRLFFEVFEDLFSAGGIGLAFDLSSPKMFSLLAAQRFPAVMVLVDVDPPALDEARALAEGLRLDVRERLVFGVFDVTAELPPWLSERAPFDLVFSMSVLEHVSPPGTGDVAGIGALLRLLRPGGVLVLSVPVAPETRAEFRDAPIYGRALDASGRVFFQRVYDAPRLGALLGAFSSEAELVRAHAVRWPRSRAWRRLVTSARLENVRALLGPLFPLLALPCRIEALPALPTRFETGDAILVLRRR
jgi:SAM-dependent methyltransferase